jgi:small GTP-binding protein
MQPDATKTGPEFKAVFVGDSSVGKTSIIMTYCSQPFSEERQPTIGSAFLSREITTKHGPAVLQIWDTAGQERYRSLVPMYCRGAAVAVVVFDITDRESFADLGGWIEQVRSDVSQGCQFVIAANKCDLPDQMDQDDIERWASQSEVEVVFVSAKSGENIELLFHTVSEKLPAAAWRLTVQGRANVDLDPTAKKKKKKRVCC